MESSLVSIIKKIPIVGSDTINSEEEGRYYVVTKREMMMIKKINEIIDHLNV